MAAHGSQIRVSEQGLRDAHRMLMHFEDVAIEEDGDVPQWVRVSRLCIEAKLEEVAGDAR